MAARWVFRTVLRVSPGKHVACEAEYVDLDPAASGSRVQIFEGAISFGSCFYVQ